METEAHRYGAGLPRVGSRALEPHERAAIHRRLWVTWIWAAVIVSVAVAGGLSAPVIGGALDPLTLESIGGVPGVFLALLGGLGLLGALVGGRGLWRIAALICVAYLLVVWGVETLVPILPRPSAVLTRLVLLAAVVTGNGHTVARIWDRARVLVRLRALRRDLHDGTVECFAGRTPTYPADETLRRFRRARKRDRGDEVQRVELLPSSGVVLRVNGRALGRLEVAHLAEVAPSQPHALRVELPSGLVGTPHPGVRLRRRSLTPAEREELARHIHSLRRRYGGVAIVTVAAIGVLATRITSTGADWRALLDPMAIGWYGLAAFTWAAYVRRILAARKLEHDRALRWVVTVDPTEPRRGPRLEVLPISQLAWTENASPATWRLTRF